MVWVPMMQCNIVKMFHVCTVRVLHTGTNPKSLTNQKRDLNQVPQGVILYHNEVKLIGLFHISSPVKTGPSSHDLQTLTDSGFSSTTNEFIFFTSSFPSPLQHFSLPSQPWNMDVGGEVKCSAGSAQELIPRKQLTFISGSTSFCFWYKHEGHGRAG